MTLSKENLLACKRFFGSHTFDRIHDAIIEIHTTYGLTLNKIVATVTDNGSNFVKAFKEFGVNTPLMFLDANGNNDVEDLEEMQLEEMQWKYIAATYKMCHSHPKFTGYYLCVENFED
ncbi:uncharacterized protein LOC118740744 [Rhagoletis pomonella]|uniref:uncharacterized protein LOC118740744 n=1 Tax=Rhagoletis pomonella TaxID=28610 RepID=UPI00177FDB8E|nr:uncharacterized protein LOC118740744 [Rhagoletis pomonella]